MIDAEYQQRIAEIETYRQQSERLRDQIRCRDRRELLHCR